MTRLDPKRREERWTIAFDARSRKHPKPAHFKPAQSDGMSRAGWTGAVIELRRWLLLIVLATAFAIVVLWHRPRQPEVITSAPRIETVDAQFSQCSFGRTRACVTDGDTIRIGSRRIGLVGFDTAEARGQCDYERALAERSAIFLQRWLNRGPFEMRIEGHASVDPYDRDLRTITRKKPDGSIEMLSDFMIKEGGARRYFGGRRNGWC